VVQVKVQLLQNPHNTHRPESLVVAQCVKSANEEMFVLPF